VYVDLSVLLAEAKEQAEQEQERKAEEKRQAHVRPWDRGKGNETDYQVVYIMLYMYTHAWLFCCAS
jgi:hypothetical protein